MKTWITADLHLGEERMCIMGRPFSNPEEMYEILLKNFNSRIESEDELIIIGDVCNKNVADKWIEKITNFNGHKILIRGNHDESLSYSELEKYFEEIIPHGHGIYRTVNKIRCYLTHYPTHGISDAFNLVGHIHGAWKVQLNSLNVGIDVHNYCPITYDDVEFYFKAICEFYDDDVWSAYCPHNQKFKNIRGKGGSYL